jgi:hypothetical protein
MSQDGNRLSKSFTDEELNDVKLIIKSVGTKIASFTDNVSEDEIATFNKLGDGDKVLITDCLSEGKDAQHLLPPYFKMSDIQTSNMLHDQLYEIEDALFELYQHTRRNRMLAGSEAAGGVSTFYVLIKTAATGKVQIPSAVAMFKRLQGYYLKRLEVSKAKKRKDEADKLAVEKMHAAEKAAAQS